MLDKDWIRTVACLESIDATAMVLVLADPLYGRLPVASAQLSPSAPGAADPVLWPGGPHVPGGVRLASPASSQFTLAIMVYTLGARKQNDQMSRGYMYKSVHMYINI